MSFSGKQWIWPDHDDERVMDLARNLELPPALARLLINRGIDDPVQARAFLCPDQGHFHSPWLMRGMEEAVGRLIRALEHNEKIVVYGDYDADGISASVILVETLQQLGGEVEYFLPSRFDEGYGLHIEPLKQFRENGASLVVTVDCGINAAEEIAYASEIGLDIIVTDHHQPLGSIKGALAVINPLQKECPYPFKELSGAGISFKLASALMEKAGSSFPDHLLDLAALGTVADVVPLLDENRIIVSAGLDVLRTLKRVGFKALAEAVSLDPGRINSVALSYILAPAINAAGRMGEALPAARLLLEKDADKAAELAVCLHQANQLRRSTEQVILKEAEEAALEMISAGDQGIITLAGENWHHGVIGIVASRLVERFNRPVALVALENAEGRGSARSIPGFDITAALADCSSLLERFGGHEQAAGFTVQAERITELRNGLNRYAMANLDSKQITASLNIEAELEADEFEFDLTSALEQLEPFGTANPVPLFGSRSWEVQSWRLVGADKKHLKLTVRKGGKTLAPIIFSGAVMEQQLERGRIVDLAFKLKNGSYLDQKTLDVEVKDLSYSDRIVSGALELTDRRNSKDRHGSLVSILKDESVKAAVFSSTLARAREIEAGFPVKGSLLFITSGSNNGKLELPSGLNTLVLYDLPLYDGLLKPFFEKVTSGETVSIHLLYSREDIKRNRLLLDHSLPTEKQLEKIYTALNSAAENAADSSFPDSVCGLLDFKPGSGFWDRVANIFTEIGVLKDNRLVLPWQPPEGSLTACLETSAAYREARELRDNCEQFQEVLLEGNLEEIATHLISLTNN